MPLFKGEGYKCTPNKAIAYITRADKAALVSSLYLDDSEGYAKQFAETARSFGKGKGYDERKYYHFKLSCDPKDNITPEQSQRLAEELALKLFTDYECVIATHTDTDIVHSHIIVNSINFATGRKLHIDNREYAAMKDMANTLGVEYQLSKLDWRKTAKTRVTTVEHHVREKNKTCIKDEIRKIIDMAVNECDSLISLRNYLEKHDISIPKLTDKTISFLYSGQKKPIRGDSLGADYTRKSIEERVLKNRERAKTPPQRKSIMERLEASKAIVAAGRGGYVPAAMPACGQRLSATQRLESAKAAVKRAAEEREAVIDVEYSEMGSGAKQGGKQSRRCKNYEQARRNAIHLTFAERLAARLMGERRATGFDYRRSAQVSYNIKMMSGTIGFLSEHGINNYSELKGRMNIIAGRVGRAELELSQLDKDILKNKQLLGASLNYQSNKAVTEQYIKKVLFRDNFFKQHQKQIESFAKAREQLRAFGIDPATPPAEFKGKLDRLRERRADLVGEIKASKSELNQWQRVEDNLRKIFEDRLPKYRLDVERRKQKAPNRSGRER